jgi:alpha-L-arabinofuranosidase
MSLDAVLATLFRVSAKNTMQRPKRRAADGKQIYIKAVNTDANRSLRTSITFTGATVASQATIETINADSITAANSFERPDAVSLQQKRIPAGSSFVVDLPSHSVR